MKRNIYIDFSYLALLASTFGAVIVLGAVVAPTIFNTNEILYSVLIDNFNAGIIMGEIFHRFSYWVYLVVIFVAAYEFIMYKKGQRDAIIFGSSVTVVFSALMFSAIYSPKILAMQRLGVEATQSDTFRNIHMASEFDFKILAIALLILFIRRLMLLKIQ
ncbi:MAG: DUF4149 domain-containing protein [Sulfurimonas sp.]|uniref:DUF4149 domain-containing protein n=1 Tax=Sulfurimonas sp. TaxID=2022749 RepID=UPI002603EA4D|nr:DUF4149 domain-containing protein [Sulfurimonas sp.]MDD5373158.1 DUF4149 domain-containing protein [Sulfurimonas sp.]